jgi:hypothetical protein
MDRTELPLPRPLVALHALSLEDFAASRLTALVCARSIRAVMRDAALFEPSESALTSFSSQGVRETCVRQGAALDPGRPIGRPCAALRRDRSESRDARTRDAYAPSMPAQNLRSMPRCTVRRETPGA